MEQAAIERAAAVLCASRFKRQPLAGLPADCRPDSRSDGYAVQEALHELISARGLGSVAGWKIGCTTPVMQTYIGIDEPCAGAVFASQVGGPAVQHLAADFVRAGVECEIAVRLGADLTPSAAPYGRADVARAVCECMTSIEIVDDRYVDFRALPAPTLIADDFFNAGCVLGEARIIGPDFDLAALRGRMKVNDQEIGAGTGADILGHPLDALAWFANLRASLGLKLDAGTFVSLGSIVRTHWVTPGDDIEAEIDGLGVARVSFS